MKEYLEIIKECPLFEDIEGSNVLPMMSCISAYTKHYEKGEIIYNEGDPAKDIGIVLKGKVELSRFDYNGNKSIITLIKTKEMFGESFACAIPSKLPVDVTALEESVIMFVNVDKLLKTCSNACSFHSKLIANLLKAVAKKNILLSKKISITSKRTTKEKLLTYLHLQSKELGSLSFDIPYDRQGLADYLEVDRSGLSAEISKLIKEGIIDCHKNHFVLKQRINI